ncbi:MAG: 4,4-diaponeurosporenoate glycosyltransferase [Actinomycetota bacterium]
MFDIFTLTEVVLGPLLVARVPHLNPAPGGIVVSPDAPVLDLEVVVPEHNAAGLVQQRPQPARIGAEATGEHSAVVTIAPDVSLASPEALDRVAAALDDEPDRPIAVYPWHKTASRYEALSTFFVLASAMTSGAFTVLGSALKPARTPSSLVASKNGATGATRVFGGGHIVAERKYPNGVRELVEGWTDRIVNARSAQPVALLLTIVFFYGAAATAVRLAADPSWAHFGWYAAYVFSISICLRQLGKFARLATLLYPITLAFFFAITLRTSLTLRGQRARQTREARAARR